MLVSPGRSHASLWCLALLGIFGAPLFLSLIIVSPYEDAHSVRAGMASPRLAQVGPHSPFLNEWANNGLIQAESEKWQQVRIYILSLDIDAYLEQFAFFLVEII